MIQTINRANPKNWAQRDVNQKCFLLELPKYKWGVLGFLERWSGAQNGP